MRRWDEHVRAVGCSLHGLNSPKANTPYMPAKLVDGPLGDELSESHRYAVAIP